MHINKALIIHVVIACLYVSPQATLLAVRQLQPADSNLPIFDGLLKQWLLDTDCFLG